MTLVMLPCADYASTATFTKSAKIMLVFPNYAKKYASTIDKGLQARGTLHFIRLLLLLF